jgi:[ribosomal protein S18]-alanine N-acetyltransferase
VIQLRDGIGADADRLFELDRVCFDAGVAYSLREFRSLLRSSKTLCILAEDGNDLAGFVIAQEAVIRKSPGGHIVTIDVAPAFRRRGIGRLLMERIEERLRAAGAGWLRLEVAVNNAAASEFYGGLGFAAVGRIPNYYHDSVDAIVMEKTLAEAGTSIP